jgi:hypothetical protein
MFVRWNQLHRLAVALTVAFAWAAAGAAPANTHWAFAPLRSVDPPAVRQSSWVQSPIDRFLLAKIEAAGLKPAAPARREVLLRRLSLDLTGLPPSLAEQDDFLKDRSPRAVERVIDRLLASSHYGERWGRHWLDLARYAESDGFEHDAVRPYSWRYRDYVVQSFNADKPYDRFLREQLAGDELWPGEPAAWIATGFNLLGPDMVDSADQVQRRLNTLNDMTDTTAAVFLGLTFGCARCHDHKSEPFTQRDYFAMQAFFAPAEFHREQAVPTAAERAAHQAAMADYDQRTRAQRREVEEIEAPCREGLFEEKLAKLSEDAQLAHRTPKERRTMEQEGTVQETAPHVKVTDTEVTKALSSGDKARRAAILAQLNKVPKPAPLPQAMVLANTNGPGPKTFVLARGDYNQPREEVQPAFPAVLLQAQALSPRTPSAARDGRAALADWLASPSNPLTARVMVNRIWQHHFGRGLVPTPGDFGTRGQPPMHPELLDWLAGEFIRGGWSVKRMHKLILLSAAYQQSTTASAAALELDPENKLFSRQNRVRLEGEVIRDSLLAISGRLNRDMGGPAVLPPIPADIVKTSKNWVASTNAEDHQRRSIYVFARRNLRFPFLEVFDAPDSNLSCPERGRSTTAPQALTLLNSDEVMEAARATASRVLAETDTADARVRRAFRLVLGRAATGKELAMARDFLKPSIGNQEITVDQKSSSLTPSENWTELCRALFNLNAFVYVD